MTPPEFRPTRSTLRVTIGAGIVLLLLGLAVAVLVSMFAPHGDTSQVVRTAPTAARSGGIGSSGSTGSVNSSGSASDAPLFIHVLGAVRKPGLYQLRAGDRVIDAVAMAGGFTAKADQSQLNLAQQVSDGEQLVVVKVGAAGAAPGGPGGAAAGASGAVGSRISINSGSQQQLETLPRVGPALAQRIIDWRTANGRFSSISDLLNVSGIGQKTLDGFKSQITL
jgi:competence protein ComEA